MVFTWQGNDEYIAGTDRSGTAHRVHVHDVGRRGGVPGGDARHAVPRPDDVGEVDCREEVVGQIEAGAGEGDDEGPADVERGRVGDGVGLADLVRGGEAAEYGRGDVGEGVAGAGAVPGGEGPADAVCAGAAGGDAEE